MAEEQKALSCPFCGGRSHHILGARQIRMLDVVKCLDCFAEIQGTYEPESALSKWNTRAQLPSQGGEAVAWMLADAVGGSMLEFQRDLLLENQCRYGGEIVPLYTHPADQVADDLTMVKVSRELLQDLRDLAFDQVEHHRAAMGAYKQTRQSAMDSVLAQADALLRT